MYEIHSTWNCKQFTNSIQIPYLSWPRLKKEGLCCCCWAKKYRNRKEGPFERNALTIFGWTKTFFLVFCMFADLKKGPQLIYWEDCLVSSWHHSMSTGGFTGLLYRTLSIAHISHNRHNWRWCTFFKSGTFWA